MEPALDTTLGHSIDEFLASLESAIKWCSWRLRTSSNHSLLRSPELHPWTFAEYRKEAVGSVVSQRSAIAKQILPDGSDLASHRESWLSTQKKKPDWAQSINAHGPLKGGRLLLYAPDETCFIGLADAETHGYFDSSDTPPWDSWVAWIEEPPRLLTQTRLRYLVSWVDYDHLSLAHSGVNVSPTACIRWLDEEPCNLREILRARGIL